MASLNISWTVIFFSPPAAVEFAYKNEKGDMLIRFSKGFGKIDFDAWKVFFDSISYLKAI